MHDFDPIVSPYNGHMLRNLSKYYLFICCKQSSSTHICRFLTTASVIDVLAGSNPMRWAQKRKAPIAGSLSNRWWAMRDVACGFAARFRFGPAALACCAGKRLRVSSAPHPCGFESLCDGPEKGKAPIAGSLSNRWWAMRDSNPEPRDYESPALTVAPIARAEREYSKTIASFTSYPLKVTGACHSGADSVEIA